MTRDQEKACLENIQSYLDRIEWLENGGDVWLGPEKVCDLCDVYRDFNKRNTCSSCPLGKNIDEGCREASGKKSYLDHENWITRKSQSQWYKAAIPQLKTRMNWLLKKYKAAGLDIEIAEAKCNDH